MAAHEHIEPHHEIPTSHGAKLYSSPTQHHTVQGVVPGDKGYHSFEGRWLMNSCRPLGKTVVGGAIDTDIAIAIMQPGCPFNGIDTV